MSFWKLFTGAVIGVGVVAAVPFTGGGSVLAGATLAGSLASGGAAAAATVAAAAGAATGYASSVKEKKKHTQEGKARGKEEAVSELASEMKAFKDKLETSLEAVKDTTAFWEDVLAMFAVGVAAANCDGEICEDEKAEIREFISGFSAVAMPDVIENKIQGIFNNPMNLNEAFELAKNSSVEMDVFDTIVKVVVHADGIVHENEEVFLQSWHARKTA